MTQKEIVVQKFFDILKENPPCAFFFTVAILFMACGCFLLVAIAKVTA